MRTNKELKTRTNKVITTGDRQGVLKFKIL